MTSTRSWHEEFLGRLDHLRRSMQTVQCVSGALWFLGATLATSAVAVLLEAIFLFSPGGRTFIVIALAFVWMLLLTIVVGAPLLRRLGLIHSLSNELLAGRVGLRFPEIRDRLLNLLQLYAQDQGSKRWYSSELITVAGERLAQETRHLEFETVVDRSPIRRSAQALVFIACGCALVAGLFPDSLSSAASRLVHYRQPFLPADAVSFEFQTATDTLVKGSSFSTLVRIRTVDPTTSLDPRAPLTFLWMPDNQQEPDRMVVRADSPGIYSVTVPNVRYNARYSALFKSYESNAYEVAVLDPPAIRSFRIRLDFPSYTALPPKLQEEFVGDIAALPGTRVTLSGTSSSELSSAEIRFSDGSSQPATIREHAFTARFSVSSTKNYTLALSDTKGLDLHDPISYSIDLIDDERPTIDLLQPGQNLDVPGETIVPLLVRIGDDYGFSRLRLAFRLTHSRFEQPWDQPRFINIPIPPSIRTTADVSHGWSLDPLDLVPEDVVEYWLEVFDNDVIRGPKSAHTPSYLLRFPSLDEVFADADVSQQRSIDEMQKALQQAEDLKETVGQLEQDMKQNKPLDWQQQKALEDVAKQYRDIEQSLDRIQKELEQAMSSMRQQDALSPETLEKYLELQQLFQQLDSAELQQALRQLQQAIQQVNRQQLQEAMQQLNFSEERFRSSIERTINLLKRIQIEQKLDETIRRAQDVRDRQSRLHGAADSSAGSNQEKLAAQQEDLERAQQEMEAAARDVQQRMEEFFAEMPVDRMHEVNRQMTEQQLGQQMKSAAQQLRSGQQRAAMQTQSQIMEQLDRLGEDLRAIQDQLLEEQSQYTMNALRRAAMNLLDLSRRQEELKNSSARSQANSPALRQNAQEQSRTLDALTKVAQNLAALGQRSFAVTPQMARSIGEALRAMQMALQSLDQRNGQAASRNQANAMAALNSSAMAVQDALEAMMQGASGGGPGGLMQQLQTLAGQQQSLNARTQSMEAAAQATRLAAEQAAIQKSLEQLNQEAERAGQSERLLGDLERLAREMSEVVRSLEQEDINPETLQQQERILSRLLDASRSLRERDYEKRRKATTGTPVARTSPSEIDSRLRREEDRLRMDLLRALDQGYSKEYEELIRKYFEQLQKLERERP